MTATQAAAALVDALNRSARASPALSSLARPKYPMRELRPQVQPDGSVTLSISKQGWEYKHRGPRPNAPPPADTEGIKQALSALIAPGLAVQAVEDHTTCITVTIGGKDHV